MKRILLLKLTSFGDLLHLLPALNDAYRIDPTLIFDWVVDRSFAEVATWHPAVSQIFLTAHRKWRKQLFRRSTFQEIQTLIGKIRENSYDLVIDGQGNFKTALLSYFTKGLRVGFDRASVREWIAHVAYQKKVAASKQMHAIDRLRILFSEAIGYPLPATPPDFSLKAEAFIAPQFPLPSRYLILIHSASWQTKLWPEEYWKRLIRKGAEEGYHLLLPWGNQEEEERAKRIAVVPEAVVLPKLTLSELGYLLQKSSGAVCVDTGLGHLAAALQIPSVSLYGPTDPSLTGAWGANQVHLASNLPCAPCKKKQCPFKEKFSPCLAQITPEIVFEIIKNKKLALVHEEFLDASYS